MISCWRFTRSKSLPLAAIRTGVTVTGIDEALHAIEMDNTGRRINGLCFLHDFGFEFVIAFDAVVDEC